MYATTLEATHHCQDEGRCINCGEYFSEHNTFTDAGWRETKISGMCENCYDELF